MSDLITPYAGLTKPTVGGDGSLWGDLLNDDLDLIDTFLRRIMPAGAVMPYAGASAPAGFLLCDGAEVSRTTYAALFAAIGTAFGAGDGSTTFRVPDMADRFPVGAGATILGGVGGSATLAGATDGHVLTVAEMPSHSHTASDAGHTHGDAGHTHGLSSSASGITLNEPPGGHSHGNSSGGQLIPMQTGSGNNLGGIDGQFTPTAITVGSATTGITLNDPSHTHAVSAGAASIQTGHAVLSIDGAGGGGAHSHTLATVAALPPFAALNFIIKT